MASQQNKQEITTSSEDVKPILKDFSHRDHQLANQSCISEKLKTSLAESDEKLQSLLIESKENPLPIQLENDNEKHFQQGEGKKRRFIESDVGEEEEKKRNVDLDLRLRPLGFQQPPPPPQQSPPPQQPPLPQQPPPPKDSPEISSTSSCMLLTCPIDYSSSSTSEENDELSNKVTEVDEAKSTLILMGCSRCLMYVMVPDAFPNCPKCNSSDLIDIFRNAPAKKTKKTN